MSDIVHIIDRHSRHDQLVMLDTLAGPDARVISLSPPDGRLDRPVEFFRLPPLLEGLLAGRLADHIGRADILHLWTDRHLPLLAAVAGKLQAGTVLTQPALPGGESLVKLPWQIGQYRLHLTLPTRRAVDTLLQRGADPTRVHHLPPAVRFSPRDDARSTIRRALGLASDAALLVVPSEMIRPAGHKLAVWAHAIVRYAGLDAHLAIPGHGPMERSVRAFSRTTTFDDLVHFTGERFTRDDLVAAADVVLLFHHRDIGLVELARAMQAARPIVALPTPDLQSLTRNGEDLLHPPRTEPKHLAATILQPLQDVECRRSLTAAAERTARTRLRPEPALRQLEGIYAT